MYRGVDWIYFSTTLLAQDSCIGSKTSINFVNTKNQVGGFYPPQKIYIDLKFLDTLSSADLQSGLGEMCHYFIVSSEKDFKGYKKSYEHVLSNKTVLADIIFKSLEIKKVILKLMNLTKKNARSLIMGHSFGHAIESLTDYSVPHGIAVSFGMDMANFISVKMGLLNSHVRTEIRELLQEIWKGYDIKKV